MHLRAEGGGKPITVVLTGGEPLSSTRTRVAPSQAVEQARIGAERRGCLALAALDEGPAAARDFRAACAAGARHQHLGPKPILGLRVIQPEVAQHRAKAAIHPSPHPWGRGGIEAERPHGVIGLAIEPLGRQRDPGIVRAIGVPSALARRRLARVGLDGMLQQKPQLDGCLHVVALVRFLDAAQDHAPHRPLALRRGAQALPHPQRDALGHMLVLCGLTSTSSKVSPQSPTQPP